MSTRHLVDPDLAPVLDTRVPTVLGARDLRAIRAEMAQAWAAPPPGDALLVQTHAIPGPSGAPGLRVVGYRPARSQGALPAILHIHGGGYVLGAPEMAEAANREIAAEIGCAVYSVDYRLAPETPHPGPLDDCYAALQWLHAQAGALGLDAGRIGVKGESAGAGLAAALALLARDRGGPPLAFQHLIYPMLDDRTCAHADPHPHVGEFFWTRANNRYGWAALLGAEPGGPGVSPYAAAARATDLSGLPPAYIAVGSIDLFLEEDLDYAARLSRAGVPIELHVYPGAFHGFYREAGARVAQAANRDSLAALRRALLG